MPDIENEPQFPLVQFADGVSAIVRQTILYSRKSGDIIKLKMELQDFIVEKLKIGKELKYTNPSSDSGWIEREFPLERKIVLGESPENPVWFMLTDWQGNKMDIAKIEHVIRVMEENRLLAKKVELLSKTLDGIMQMTDDLIDRPVMFMQRTAPLYDKTRTMLEVIEKMGRKKEND